MTAHLPVVFGCSGPELLEEEAVFFEEAQPAGFILFARNCVSPEQVKILNSRLREIMPDAHILIDQEGGRVMRMKPPVWPNQPAPKLYGEMYDRSPIMACESLKKDTIDTARLLKDHGFTVNCVPCADLFVPGAHTVIGDRAFHENPDVVAVLAETQARAFLGEGVQPVIKHLPGHGKSNMDSHKDMPVIDMDMSDDIATFKRVVGAMGSDLWGMAAHCVYPRLDSSGLPASVSKTIIQDVIRGEIGLTGLLLSDDLGMEALSVIGGPAERAQACLEAGCDLVLHCNGKIVEMREILASF